MDGTDNWSRAAGRRLRADRWSLAKLWGIAGIALAAFGTAWLAYSYRQSGAAAPTTAAALPQVVVSRPLVREPVFVRVRLGRVEVPVSSRLERLSRRGGLE